MMEAARGWAQGQTWIWLGMWEIFLLLYDVVRLWMRVIHPNRETGK